MIPGARSAAMAALVTLLGTGLLWWGSDGLVAFTAESARRAHILRAPRALPPTQLEDQDGNVFRLQDYRGKLLAVEFIYTRCGTICRTLGMSFKQIRDRVAPQALGRDFALLTISFDTQSDDPARLKAYASAYGADGKAWRVARVPDAAQLKRLLDAFGIVVIPDGLGGFEHNAALHLLGRDGRLALIGDIDQPLAFADQAARW